MTALTWTFRIAGVLLALFGGANVLAAMLTVNSEPGWLPAVLFIGGALAMAAGVFHATARVVD